VSRVAARRGGAGASEAQAAAAAGVFSALAAAALDEAAAGAADDEAPGEAAASAAPAGDGGGGGGDGGGAAARDAALARSAAVGRAAPGEAAALLAGAVAERRAHLAHCAAAGAVLAGVHPLYSCSLAGPHACAAAMACCGTLARQCRRRRPALPPRTVRWQPLRTQRPLQCGSCHRQCSAAVQSQATRLAAPAMGLSSGSCHPLGPSPGPRRRCRPVRAARAAMLAAARGRAPAGGPRRGRGAAAARARGRGGRGRSRRRPARRRRRAGGRRDGRRGALPRPGRAARAQPAVRIMGQTDAWSNAAERRRAVSEAQGAPTRRAGRLGAVTGSMPGVWMRARPT